MKIGELRQKSPGELKELLAVSREKLRDARFRAAYKQLKDVREIREAKETIAKILTIIREQKK